MEAAEEQVVGRLTERLKSFGLTTTEAKVYLHLSKIGEGTAIELAKVLGVQRTEIYAILRSLQNKGIVLCTVRRPARFATVPLDRALSLLIDSERVRLKSMEASKEEMISLWQKVKVSAPEELESRFQMLTGTEQIFARISDLLSSPYVPKMVCCSGTTLSKMYYAGVFDSIQTSRARREEVLILTEVTQRNSSTVSSLKARVRHVQVSHPPGFVINGENDFIFILGHHEEEKATSAIWSSHKPLVRSMRALFRRLWEDAIDLEEIQLTTLKGIRTTKLVEARRRLVPLRTALEGLLREAGYKVVSDFKLQGASGITHPFDIFAESEGRLPLVVDISGEDMVEVDVLRMYAKLKDLVSVRAKAVLIFKGKTSEKARELANTYGIKLIEVQ